MEFQYLLQGLVAVASRAEAVGRAVKQRFKDRMEQSAKNLLPHSISNRGDDQRAELARLLGNILSSQGEGIEGTVLQIALQSREILDQISFKHFDADPVDACCATVAFDRLEGGVQKWQGNPPSEGVCFWFGDGKQGHDDFS